MSINFLSATVFFLCILFLNSNAQNNPVRSPSQVTQPIVQNSNTLSEKDKIEILIKSVQNMEGADFYRNGSWYDGKAAAEHLRFKLRRAGGTIKTAHDFIDKIATSSSFSGEAYKIKMQNGVIISANSFFNNKLNEIERKK